MPSADDLMRAQTLALIDDYQRLIRQKRLHEWIELWDENGVLEFPFAPAGSVRSFHGKAAILAQMTKSMDRIVIDKVDYFRVMVGSDPTKAVIEAAIRGTALETGQSYDQAYVLFVETQKGKLWRYREYFNPVISMDSYGGRDAWTAGYEFDQSSANPTTDSEARM